MWTTHLRAGLAKKTRYCVRPNSGRIEVGKDVEVQGMMTSEETNVASTEIGSQFCFRL